MERFILFLIGAVIALVYTSTLILIIWGVLCSVQIGFF